MSYILQTNHLTKIIDGKQTFGNQPKELLSFSEKRWKQLLMKY